MLHVQLKTSLYQQIKDKYLMMEFVCKKVFEVNYSLFKLMRSIS